jgi:hypothetical protein
VREERKKMKKLCIIGIFMILMLIPVSSAIGTDDTIDNESYKKSEIYPLDIYNEKISIISGYCQSVNTKGFFFNEPIDIVVGSFSVYLLGFKQPDSGSSYFEVEVDNSVQAPRFIGMVRELYNHPDQCYKVIGIALGNIEWN